VKRLVSGKRTLFLLQRVRRGGSDRRREARALIFLKLHQSFNLNQIQDHGNVKRIYVANLSNNALRPSQQGETG
jgi:hypothetical protein